MILIQSDLPPLRAGLNAIDNVGIHLDWVANDSVRLVRFVPWIVGPRNSVDSNAGKVGDSTQNAPEGGIRAQNN